MDFQLVSSYKPRGDQPRAIDALIKAINRITGAVGLTPLQWLGEPTGLFQLLVGKSLTLPAWEGVFWVHIGKE